MLSDRTDVPAPHRAMLRRCVDVLAADARIVGVAGGGSLVTGGMDEFSDLDLVVAVEPAAHAQVLAERPAIAAAIGRLLAAFTGEHVGEPRLLICLYGEPLLHVDLKFVALPDVAVRVEDPIVLFERDGRLTQTLRGAPAVYPAPDPQWVEDRFWVWVHYVATKIGRGELFEAIEGTTLIRTLALGPLALAQGGVRPTGVRRIERSTPAVARELRRTVGRHDRGECVAALRAAIDVYRSLRSPAVERRSEAEGAAIAYLAAVEGRHG